MRLRRDRQAVRGARQAERRLRSTILHPQRVACEGMGELGHGTDVACAQLSRGHVLLAAWKEDLGQALLTAAAEIGQMLVRLDRAGDDLEIADPAELVAAGAEDEGLRRLVGLRLRRRQKLADG